MRDGAAELNGLTRELSHAVSQPRNHADAAVAGKDEEAEDAEEAEEAEEEEARCFENVVQNCEY